MKKNEKIERNEGNGSNERKERKGTSTSMKGKGRVIGLVVCFVAAVVMVSTYTFRSYQNKMNDEIAKSKELAQSMEKEENADVSGNDIVNPEAGQGDSSLVTDGEDTDDAEETEDGSAGESDDPGAATAGLVSSASFTAENVIDWPASGSVILDYSMEHTIYFPTLAEYRYNPALIIGGAAGEDIRAGAAGTVTDIHQSVKSGNTVTLDVGNGYTMIYGQLKDVPLTVGDYVEQGSIVGYLSEPTKYYSKEGTNLYFAMEKDGESVNPMDFME